MLKQLWLQAKRRYLPHIIAYTAKIGMRLILRTCRIKVHGLDQFVTTAAHAPCILMLWHNRLAAVPEVMHRFTSKLVFTAFISKSRDGEPLALLTNSYKIGRVLRVPHNARHHALGQMIQHLKARREIMIITPDGPRGPRYVVKPGVAIAAREADAKIVPFSWTAASAWQLKTWDKMLIPKPFTTVHITFGEAIALNKNADEDLAQQTDALRAALLAIGKDER